MPDLAMLCYFRKDSNKFQTEPLADIVEPKIPKNWVKLKAFSSFMDQKGDFPVYS